MTTVEEDLALEKQAVERCHCRVLCADMPPPAKFQVSFEEYEALCRNVERAQQRRPEYKIGTPRPEVIAILDIPLEVTCDREAI